MPQPRTNIITEHRLARFVAWLAAVLAWFALGGPRRTRAQARHHRRHRHVDIGVLRRAVRDLIIIRAAQLSPARTQRTWRSFAPAGFRGRRSRCTVRAVAGVWLRRYLHNRGSFIDHVKHLLEALRHYRALGAALAWRRRFGLTRLAPILCVSPRAHAACAQFTPAASIADTS